MGLDKPASIARAVEVPLPMSSSICLAAALLHFHVLKIQIPRVNLGTFTPRRLPHLRLWGRQFLTACYVRHCLALPKCSRCDHLASHFPSLPLLCGFFLATRLAMGRKLESSSDSSAMSPEDVSELLGCAGCRLGVSSVPPCLPPSGRHQGLQLN